MAKKIIILERENYPSDLDYRVAFWLTVPTARQPFYANAEATSTYKDATDEELAAIRSGAIKEVVLSQHFEATQDAKATTVADIKTQLIKRYQALQAALDKRNDWNQYGTCYDGDKWTNAGVA